MKKFSMMELLVVMGILLLMMGLLLPTVGPMMNRAELSKTVVTIMGQLEVGFAKSLEKSQIIRVSFCYDPKGKNIDWQQMLTSEGNEVAARNSRLFDINNDGIPAGYSNKQVYWLKFYMVDEIYKASALSVEDLMLLPGAISGPYWFRRPVSRTKDSSGIFRQTKMSIWPIISGGKKYYFRPVINEGYLPIGVTANNKEFLKPIDDPVYGTFTLIDDKGGVMDYTLTKGDIIADAKDTILLTNTYRNSVALYKKREGDRFLFVYGSLFNNYYIGQALPQDQKYDITSAWFDIMEGDESDPNALDYGANEDEDRSNDEGMSVSVETYNQSGNFSKSMFPDGLTPYNKYFDKIEDVNLKLGREFFIGGKDRKGVMLRRVWGVKPGQAGFTLLWSSDKIFSPGVSPANVYFAPRLPLVTPYYFYVIFDQKNGYGMSFGTSSGSAQVSKLYFQVCDDDNKLTALIEMGDGTCREGSLTDMAFPTSKVGLDAMDYFQGVSK